MKIMALDIGQTTGLAVMECHADSTPRILERWTIGMLPACSDIHRLVMDHCVQVILVEYPVPTQFYSPKSLNDIIAWWKQCLAQTKASIIPVHPSQWKPVMKRYMENQAHGYSWVDDVDIESPVMSQHTKDAYGILGWYYLTVIRKK